MGQLLVHKELRTWKLPPEITIPQQHTWAPRMADEKPGHGEAEFLTQAEVSPLPTQASKKG